MVDRPRVPTFKIWLNSKVFDQDIKHLIESLSIVDKLEGESDTIEVTLNNYDGRWLSSWMLEKGDRLVVRFGYVGEILTTPVEYEIDEMGFRFAPDTVAIKGQATPVSEKLRQKESKAYEETSLRQIAAEIAAKHGLKLVGKIPDVKFTRLTQKNETDLEFLRRQALRYGAVFKIESCKKLVFATEKELEEAEPVITIDRRQLKASSALNTKTVDTYKSAVVQYKDPKTDKLHKAKATSARKKNQDQLTIAAERFETPEQAKLRAEEALRKANASEVEGNLDLEGEVTFVAGLNLELTGMGRLSGKYQIKEVKQDINTRSGFTSSLSVRKIEGDGKKPKDKLKNEAGKK